MGKMKTLIAASVMMLAMATGSAEAATLIIDAVSGKLTSVVGLIANGKSYDVSFVEGTCASIFGVCSSANFDFATKDEARIASQELGSLILGNTTAGSVRNHPDRIFGCEDYVSCGTRIPYRVDNNKWVYSATLAQSSSGFWEVFYIGEDVNSDTLSISNQNFARFAESPAAIPEPATWVMMLVGFGGIGIAIRRRRVAENAMTSS